MHKRDQVTNYLFVVLLLQKMSGENSDGKIVFAECEKALETGDDEGIYWLGYCYEFGIGTEKHWLKAFIHYQMAAMMGHPRAIYQMVFICYNFGIGIKKNESKASKWFKKYNNYRVFLVKFNREIEHGKCTNCNEYNTSYAWCQTCNPDIITQGWTSGNKIIDNYIKECQLRTDRLHYLIEWIPFDRLEHIKKIGEGGFGSVFSATWLDYIIGFDDKRIFREPEIVALKTLKHIDDNLNFLKEGNLHEYLVENFINLNWKVKLKLLKDIAVGLLINIHEEGLIHSDFHSGNILQDDDKGAEFIRSYISDLGLSKRLNENNSKEILSGESKFTQAADIYSFGVIMAEMSTGRRPFYGRDFDAHLAIEIYNGLRPDFSPGTPDCYIKLARQCMSLKLQERPDFEIVCDTIIRWYELIKDADDVTEHEIKPIKNFDDYDDEDVDFDDNDDVTDHEIKKQFLDADRIDKTLPSKRPDHMYISKPINTREISSKLQMYK
ncbi:kinase-like domain-containing protein [Gigaspora rosea]|uniref:Kinase-like domain-containing protein n=1 Tax=Gigaspora rosea TaxID=44941 RepID=A0A397V3D1_9GLOM|nr:kinase-like domain-containing protein [Gigaspora rosea]